MPCRFVRCADPLAAGGAGKLDGHRTIPSATRPAASRGLTVIYNPSRAQTPARASTTNTTPLQVQKLLLFFSCRAEPVKRLSRRKKARVTTAHACAASVGSLYSGLFRAGEALTGDDHGYGRSCPQRHIWRFFLANRAGGAAASPASWAASGPAACASPTSDACTASCPTASIIACPTGCTASRATSCASSSPAARAGSTSGASC